MSKQELGVKRDCPVSDCGARFYDLCRSPALCPKCGVEFVPEALLKPRKPRPDDAPAAEEEKPEKPAQETSLEDADNENAAATSNRKAGLDDETEEDDIEGIEDIEDIDIDDDDDDDALLEDDDDDDVTGIVTPAGDGDDDDT